MIKVRYCVSRFPPIISFDLRVVIAGKKSGGNVKSGRRHYLGVATQAAIGCELGSKISAISFIMVV